jgi:hypothetical protein
MTPSDSGAPRLQSGRRRFHPPSRHRRRRPGVARAEGAERVAPIFRDAYLDKAHPQHDWAVRKMASLIRQEHGRL